MKALMFPSEFQSNPPKSILIIGMAGGLARLTAELIAKRMPEVEITGVDPRDTKPFINKNNISFIKMKYTRGNFEKLFRDKDFDVIYHLGRMSHVGTNPIAGLSQRLDLNVMGTKRILDLALKTNVKKMIILSTYHVYGAFHDNPVYITEDSPLRASLKYPELRDVVEMDQLATNWLWKNQSTIETVVLRPCSIIGPQINNSITKYLTTKYAPIGIDFNPMFQFIHEFDMAQVLLATIKNVPTGVYNVAPQDVISIRAARKIVGQKSLNIPLSVVEPMAKVIKKLWTFPDYLIDYVKYPCIIDPKEMNKYLPEDTFRFSIKESLELLKK
jgi:UDP-glucose 4-epimerase